MASLPKVLYKCIVKESYELSPKTAFVRTDMEVGPARQRRNTTAPIAELKIKFIFDQHQLRIFEAWYKHKVFQGTAWFTMPVKNGIGSTETDVRFTEAPSFALSGTYFEVDCSLECRELKTMSEEELDAILGE